MCVVQGACVWAVFDEGARKEDELSPIFNLFEPNACYYLNRAYIDVFIDVKNYAVTLFLSTLWLPINVSIFSKPDSDAVQSVVRRRTPSCWNNLDLQGGVDVLNYRLGFIARHSNQTLSSPARYMNIVKSTNEHSASLTTIFTHYCIP
mmetsp:Transcript_2740/g.4159  ORF Transcript_2740/g.4159 Transcript_2740/m.4159 type:complete len:148 (-) Transcript_2740:589-1032(-)